MENIGIPDALVHGDINPGNILIDDDRCVFTDWAQAGISTPFVTFEHLKRQLTQDAGKQSSVCRLSEIYRGSWRSMLTDCQVDSAAMLSPLIAIAAYLYGRRD